MPTLRRTDILLVACGSFLTGLLVARLHVSVPFWSVLLFGLALLFPAKKLSVRLLVVLLFGLSLGVWRGGVFLQAIQPYQDFAVQKVTVQATATTDAIYGQNSQLSFEVSHIHFITPKDVTVPGTMKIGGFGELAVYRGDVLEITGKLYPTRGGKQATIGYAQFKRIASHQTVIDELRRKFVAGMQTALPEPVASFGLGLLIGQRNTLPYETSQALLMVGLTHIIAVSGYNLTILLNAARRLLGNRSKRLTTIVGVSLMSFFLLFTGASASIVRAAVVSGLGLAAWYYGRSVRPMVLLMLAAALTTYATPVYLWSDIGWWLSMLAFFGILVIAPSITSRLYKKREAPMLVQIAIETFSAELMTIPLIMFIFGQVSFIGLLANMLVASIIPLAMLLSFIAGLAGMLVPLLAGWFAWPANLLLTYMLDTATLLSRVPHVFQTNVYMGVFDMALCYLLIVAFAIVLKRKAPVWFEEVTDRTRNV
jgi:ComEC/Rec2-related protein